MAEISKRKRIWGWWFFDWASQPYHTVLNTFIFGPFFAAIAANSLQIILWVSQSLCWHSLEQYGATPQALH